MLKDFGLIFFGAATCMQNFTNYIACLLQAGVLNQVYILLLRSLKSEGTECGNEFIHSSLSLQRNFTVLSIGNLLKS